MIEVLNGIKETVIYESIEGFKLHDNTNYEAYPEHWHTPIEIIMPLKNHYNVSNKNAFFTLQEGDILFLNSGVLHGMPSTIHGERLILQVDFALLHNVAGIESTLSTIPQALLLTPETAPSIHEQLKQLMLNIFTEYYSGSILIGASIYAKFLEMLVLIGREYSGQRTAFDTTSHKQKEHAEKLLVDPELSITEVALQSGFSSLSAFIRMFKLIKDCTPTEFRNLYEY